MIPSDSQDLEQYLVFGFDSHSPFKNAPAKSASHCPFRYLPTDEPPQTRIHMGPEVIRHGIARGVCGAVDVERRRQAPASRDTQLSAGAISPHLNQQL